MKSVRVAGRAIIIHENKLLLNKNQKYGDIYYTLPGGGQEHGETIEETVIRECREEVGAEVKVLNLCFVRDYISSSHEFADLDPEFHQIELIFKCKLISFDQDEASETDDYQIGIEWLNISDLRGYNIYPKSIVDHIIAGKWVQESIYLGNIN